MLTDCVDAVFSSSLVLQLPGVAGVAMGSSESASAQRGMQRRLSEEPPWRLVSSGDSPSASTHARQPSSVSLRCFASDFGSDFSDSESDDGDMEVGWRGWGKGRRGAASHGSRCFCCSARTCLASVIISLVLLVLACGGLAFILREVARSHLWDMTRLLSSSKYKRSNPIPPKPCASASGPPQALPTILECRKPNAMQNRPYVIIGCHAPPPSKREMFLHF